MVERISFTLKFLFNDKDQSKALKLHRLLREYGVVGNIVCHKDEGINKAARLDAILDVMRPGRIYTTGKLWRAYSIVCETGYKTFQRDLNTLIIQGRVKGFRKQGFGGNTIMWSRGDVDEGIV